MTRAGRTSPLGANAYSAAHEPPTDAPPWPSHTGAMSDDAALWKLAFGVLILAICGLTVAMRKPPAAPARAPALIAQPAAPAAPVAPSLPAVQHEPPPPRLQIVTDDVQDEPPASGALVEADAPGPKSRSHRARQCPPRMVAVASRPHRAMRRRHHVPIERVASAQPQYPFDPRERWNPRF